MRLWLPAAASYAPEVDQLMLGLLLLSGVILAMVFALMATFIWRYRHNSPIDRGQIAERTWRIETGWTAATLVVFFGLFLWGAHLYVVLEQAPLGATKIYAVGKQWMWKIQHAGGQREINTLHVPVNTTIEVVLTSEDVIHDFFIPAFRIKHDVLPARYDSVWFKATKTGHYHLFCSQFCGTLHSSMTGEVIVMSALDYRHWLEQNGTSESLVAQGQTLFMRFGCSGCHGSNGVGGAQSGSLVRAPQLAGLYGSPVTLTNGTIVTADDRYIRDCILLPETVRVASYPPVMPSFAGQITEDELLKIIAYIESLGPEHGS
jgi:cytochrome c oxidase subunit II